MKKAFLLGTIILINIFLFAETFTYTPSNPDIFTARDVALVDNYIADYSTYFSMWSNPANIGLTGNKLLLPFVSLKMSGDFAEAVSLISSIAKKDDAAILESLTTPNPINVDLGVTGPICVGAIFNNFGWGFYNNTYIKTNINGPTNSKLTGGEQSIFITGYAYPIKLPLNTIISIGFDAKGFADIQGCYDGSTITAISNLINKDYNFFPTYGTLGFGIDAGATVSLFDILVVSVSWQNLFAGTYSQKFDSFDMLTKFDMKYDVLSTLPLDDTLIFGLAINLPLKKATHGFITTSNLYANYSNCLDLFDSSVTVENPLYMLSAGFEFEMFNTISLRVGINKDRMSAGMGLNMGIIVLDVAAYSQALGLKPSTNELIGFSFSLGTYY